MRAIAIRDHLARVAIVILAVMAIALAGGTH